MKPPTVVLGLMYDTLKNPWINMHSGLPAEFLSLLRCPNDQQPVDLEQPEWAEGSVIGGRLRFAGRRRNHSITDGIAILLETQDLDVEGQREQRLRDAGGREDFRREAQRHEWV